MIFNDYLYILFVFLTIKIKIEIKRDCFISSAWSSSGMIYDSKTFFLLEFSFSFLLLILLTTLLLPCWMDQSSLGISGLWKNFSFCSISFNVYLLQSVGNSWKFQSVVGKSDEDIDKLLLIGWFICLECWAPWEIQRYCNFLNKYCDILDIISTTAT